MLTEMELEPKHTQEGSSYEVSVAVCSSLPSLKPKRIIESRAKRSSKIISLGYYSIMLASSHTVKMDFNSLVYSFHALSTLRCSGLRTASTAAKPCQGDSLEFYLITGIPTVAAAGQRDVNSQLHAHTLNSLLRTKGKLKDLQHSFRNSDVCCYVQEKCGMRVQTSQPHKKARIHKHGIHDHISEPSSSKLVLKVVPLANKTAPSKQELDILFNPLCDEFFTAGTLCVNKSSSPTDNSTQQDTPPLETAQSTTELITPTTTIIVEDNMGKENGIYILYLIDHGSFELGTTKDTLGTIPEEGVLLRLERPRTYDDLNDNENKRFDADLNSKFVNNMSPKWDRFVTAVKLNKGLKEINHEQLYAYLKQHKKHVTQDRLIVKRITPMTNDGLAFFSSVQPYTQSSPVQFHQYPPSSAPLLSPYVQSLLYSQFSVSSQLDSGYTQADEILDTLTKQVALLS
nr:hypothetical protein [Tanacetum cinerariifolium]